eukprot:394445_1
MLVPIHLRPNLECLGRLSKLVAHSDEVWSSLIISLIDWAFIELENNVGSMMARSGVKVLVAISKSTARGCRDVWSTTGRFLLSSASILSRAEGQQLPGGSITYSQQAALHVLVTLAESIYDKMDMAPSPLQPFVTDLVRCMTDAAQSMIVHVACLGISGLCAVITHPPSPILSDGEVKDILQTLTVLLNTTLHDVTVPDKRTLELMVDKSLLPVPAASLAALREIGIKKPRYAHQLLDISVASLSLIMDDYTSLASKGVSVSRQGLARVFYSLRALCEIPEVFEIVVPDLLSWGIKMSSENNNCLDNSDDQDDQVNQMERINLNVFGAETALSQLAYALEYKGREISCKQKFCHKILFPLITHVLDNRGDRRSKVLSSVLRIVSCCMRRADAEAQDAFLDNLLQLLRERGTGRNYSILAAALGVIRNESPLLSAITNDPEPLNSIVRIVAGTGTTITDMSSGTIQPDNEKEACCKCLASLLNKLPPGDSLERTMTIVKKTLHSSLFEIQEDVEGKSFGSSSLCLRIWACKGLIMRDSGEDGFCKELMDELWGSVVANNMESASAFQTLIVEEEDGNFVTNVPVFYKGRKSPIWKQKLLFTFLPEINVKLKLSSGCQPVLPYTSEDAGGSPNLALLLAALHIFSAVPLKVLDTVAEAATEAATRGLVSMVLAMFQPSFHLLSILCCSAPIHVAGRLPRLVPALLGLACSSQSAISASVKGSVCADAKSREASLGILICISRLPRTELLYEYRRVVLKSLMPALDDPRRSVRQSAVKARNVWSLLG